METNTGLDVVYRIKNGPKNTLYNNKNTTRDNFNPPLPDSLNTPILVLPNQAEFLSRTEP